MSVLDRFLMLSPAGQLKEIKGLRDRPDVLRKLRRHVGLRECPVNCTPERLPCPKHTLWRSWRDSGLEARAIAHAWECKSGERTLVKEVKCFLSHKRERDCGCLVKYVPCPHVFQTELPVELAVLWRLYWLIDPLLYAAPPPPPRPIVAASRGAKARLWAIRARDNVHYAHPGDLPSLRAEAPILQHIGTPAGRGPQGQLQLGPPGEEAALRRQQPERPDSAIPLPRGMLAWRSRE